jgi:hypothetical protein
MSAYVVTCGCCIPSSKTDGIAFEANGDLFALLARGQSTCLRGFPQVLSPSGSPALSSRAQALTESASPALGERAPAKQKKQRGFPFPAVPSGCEVCSTRHHSCSHYVPCPGYPGMSPQLYRRDHSTWMEELFHPPGKRAG